MGGAILRTAPLCATSGMEKWMMEWFFSAPNESASTYLKESTYEFKIFLLGSVRA